MHKLDLGQQRYDSMLPPDNSTTEEEVVSTHSRPKAAGVSLKSVLHGGRVSTHSRPKAAGSTRRTFAAPLPVSTHSRPKAAG